MRCQWRLSCTISVMLSYAERLLQVSSTHSATNAESGVYRSPDLEPARIGNSELKGSTGFERTYTLAGAAGEHQPEAIRRLILQLVPTRSSSPLFLSCSSRPNTK